MKVTSHFPYLRRREVGGSRGTLPKPTRAAFSLIELLVATTVFSLLCVLMFSIVSSSTGLWRTQEAQEESFREARAALNFLSRDLANAMVTTNAQWFYASSNRIAFLTSLPPSSQSDGRDRGDLCAVGYSLEWAKVDPDDASEIPRLALYRYVRFSVPTHRSLIMNSAVSIEQIFEAPDSTDTVRELLARNMSRFSCDLYSTNSLGEPVPFAPAEVMPKILQFSMSVLNDGTASKLTSRAQWEDASSPLILQNERTFTLRVRPAKP
jgi:type II secretory pathway pseudopilin PulG